jgi:acetate kinase
MSPTPDLRNAILNSILVLNSGSSSLKAGLFVRDETANFAGERAVLVAQANGINQGGGTLAIRDDSGRELASTQHALGSQGEALESIAAAFKQHSPESAPYAIGHRIVHGGPKLQQHVRLTPAVLETLRQSIHFAPLHLPGAIRIVEQAGKLYPNAQQVACFDTTFHRTMPPVAKRLPIPEEYAAQGVERYGFHGLSYESLVGQLRAEPARLPDRIVCAHLGGGSSLCAVLRGASVDTTMSLTPAGGVPMATRTGDIDPGVLFFLGREGRLSVDALETLVNHKSGLAAVSGGSGDMQQLEKSMTDESGDVQKRAALAFAIFATAIAKQIAALTVTLAGLDLLVFTGGIGEHSAALRAAVVERLAPFGLRLDGTANRQHAENIHSPASKVPVRILAAEEDLVIAAHTRRLVGLPA